MKILAKRIYTHLKLAVHQIQSIYHEDHRTIFQIVNSTFRN